MTGETRPIPNVLVDVLAAIDVDYGIIDFMRISKLFDEKFFDTDVVTASIPLLRNKIIANPSSNPLNILFKEEYHNSTDSLYEEIYNKYEKEILVLSPPTDALRITYNWRAVETMNMQCAVNCRTDLQYEYIKKLVDADYPVFKDRYSLSDPYNMLMLEDVADSVLYSNIKHHTHTLLLLNKACNYDERSQRVKEFAFSYFPCTVSTLNMYVGYNLIL